ncbi:DUF983 domain-containing protein [Roseivirga echinicomitans]|uniref:DUF983 domain-containing protein n=1 Tax=Roseivirga echinicomitans TaxID=296218 RepID=A0A150XA12_9BACT|nr:DUF983 domain-containing protein [Roseivirga echinicomitans]KYG75502.1 hypothetical protein AWN68_08130 [Roseivirga echinicomitans]
MVKRTKLSAVFQARCPQCREGKLFISKAYNLRKFLLMKKVCDTCGARFEKEPRFYDGSMYISYAMSVGLFLMSALVINYTIENANENTYLIAIISEVILLYPLMYRYSRVLFLYSFGGLKYTPKQNN